MERYQASSGQIINKTKSKMFLGGMTQERQEHLHQMLNIQIGALPEKFLGVPLTAGIRWILHEVTSRSQWLIGDGNKVDLWRDVWVEHTSSTFDVAATNGSGHREPTCHKAR
ncbi:hypothetical protein IFM89_016800 [Coptis chinensis]|uniref:Uncharacterized protein n=1 Tax=Coptis chinensis TaxID=261450 RepID=A0A835ITS5_9MAGN|nr:hypothetical protein IFM89_016800 [Coptis chinensis]